MVFALIGNQNCGKTALFNQLTGSNQHVGNFPGVTVDSKTGQVRSLKNASVVDLPGIYSIRPYTGEEVVTRDFLLDSKPDAIINIVDATNIERNLYLTLQLLEMHIPLVLALNMMDEVRNNGGSVDVEKLSVSLGVPAVPICAVKNEGVEELIHEVGRVASQRQYPQIQDFCATGAVHRCIHTVAHQVEDHAQKAGMSPRFAATKIIEGDSDVTGRLALNENELEMIEHSICEMEQEEQLDRNALMADMRYTFIENACRHTVVRVKESKEHKRSVKIDNILTNKYASLPLFVAILFAIFWLTFEVIGSGLSDLLAAGIDSLTGIVNTALIDYGINEIVRGLLIDGVFAGVGSVLSFLPIIVTLFFFLSVLEDTGYMARVAFVTDKLLRKIGLSGKSIVPMLIGFGCSVPAIMATRTLSSEKDRRMTAMLIPFMSCSAKIPIYAVFSAAFFEKGRAFVMIGLYLGGIAVGIISALIYKRTLFKGKPMPFVMELPNYRLPSAKSVFFLMWEKAKDFLVKAFTIIFAATVVIWFLESFDSRLNPVEDSSLSLLASIGRGMAPIFKPLGFGDWRMATSLITGLSAKEAVVSTLSVLMGVSGEDALAGSLSQLLTPLQGIAFLTFTLLYTPCVAAIAAIKREFGSWLKTFAIVLLQCGVAWLAALLVYKVGGVIIGLA